MIKNKHILKTNEEKPTFLIKLGKLIIPPILNFIFHLKIEGKENLPEKGPFIVASNHYSNWDPPILGYAVLPHLLNYMAKKELFKYKLIRNILHACYAFEVDRDSMKLSTIRTIQFLVDHKRVILMFPEGTRMKNKSMDQIQIKSGTSFIAYKFKLPILPIHINWPDKLSKTVLKRLPVRIKIKPPIIPDKEHIRDYFPEKQIMDLPDKEVINLLTPFILKKIQYPET